MEESLVKDRFRKLFLVNKSVSISDTSGGRMRMEMKVKIIYVCITFSMWWVGVVRSVKWSKYINMKGSRKWKIGLRDRNKWCLRHNIDIKV